MYFSKNQKVEVTLHNGKKLNGVVVHSAYAFADSLVAFPDYPQFAKLGNVKPPQLFRNDQIEALD
jgi:hypothetical protein